MSFFRKKFSPWGPSFADSVLALYNVSDFLSVQQHYDSVSSDIHVICGNLEIAKMIATNQENSVYFYIATQHPALPQCLFDMPSYCARYNVKTTFLLFVANIFSPKVCISCLGHGHNVLQ